MGIFLTQGSNPGLLHCKQILYHLSHQGSPKHMWFSWKYRTGASEKEFINMVKSIIHTLWKVLYFKDRFFASPYKLTWNSVDCPDQKVADPASRASLYLSWDTVCSRCSFVCLKDRDLDFTELPWTGCMTVWMLLWLLINRCLYEWQNSVWDLLLR